MSDSSMTVIGAGSPSRPGIPPTLIFRPDSFFDPLDIASLFGQSAPLEVELGSGDGSFLAAWATLNPGRNFLGVERLLGRLRKLDRKGLRGGLKNLRLIRVEAGHLVDIMLPPRSVTALHVYFPDPWPKRRHHKNRLVHESFPAMARRALKPGGIVFLRTDFEEYFTAMQDAFRSHAAFVETSTPAELLAVHTDFERGFRERNLPIYHTACRLES